MIREKVLYVLSTLGFQNIKIKTKNIQFSCPLASIHPYNIQHKNGVDSRPSMGVSTPKNEISMVHCFTCKFKGPLDWLVTEMFRLDLIEEEKALHLASFIAECETVPLDDLVSSIPSYDIRNEIKEEKVFEESKLKPYSGRTHKYLTNRGLLLETIKTWEGGYDSRYARVTFPVRNWYGHLVGLVGRSIQENPDKKYYNYWNFETGNFLFGEHKIVNNTTIIVVEGLLDAIMLWQALVSEHLLNRYSVAAILGSNITNIQCRKIIRFGSDLIIFFDNDEVGWKGRDKIGKALQEHLLTRCVRYENRVETDPFEMIQKGRQIGPILEDAQLFVG